MIILIICAHVMQVHSFLMHLRRIGSLTKASGLLPRCLDVMHWLALAIFRVVSTAMHQHRDRHSCSFSALSHTRRTQTHALERLEQAHDPTPGHCPARLSLEKTKTL